MMKVNRGGFSFFQYLNEKVTENKWERYFDNICSFSENYRYNYLFELFHYIDNSLIILSVYGFVIFIPLNVNLNSYFVK